MGTLIEVDRNLLFLDLDRGRDVEEISEDLFGLSSLIFAANLLGHESIQGAGHEGDLEVKVTLSPTIEERASR